MKLTLHKLPEGFIVTSDEKYKGERCKTLEEYYSKFYSTDCGNTEEIIITKQDQIDFSTLSEEEQKKIGWFDLKKISDNWLYYNLYNMPRGYPLKPMEYGVQQGFQIAQKILSDRSFTLEDMIDFAKYQQDYKENASVEDNFQTWKLKFMSQPKSWEIECEWKNGKLHILKLL
jgi:hypothetical protein